MSDVPAPPPTLDELYWHSDLPIAVIADRLGVPARGMHTVVTPLAAGVCCYRCDAALTYASRSSRSDHWLRCTSCGTRRRNPAGPHARSEATRPTAVGGTILVREDRDIGPSIEACIDVLARAGLAWDHRSLAILGRTAGDGGDVIDELRASGPGTLAVPSLQELGGTQTERLQALFVLTTMRWRVLAASDVRGYERPEPLTARHLERLDEWYEPDAGWSPTWSEHLVESAFGRTPVGRWW